MENNVCGGTSLLLQGMRGSLAAFLPTAANLRGHSHEGDIHHSDGWMLWRGQSIVRECGHRTITVTTLMQQRPTPRRIQARAEDNHHCFISVVATFFLFKPTEMYELTVILWMWTHSPIWTEGGLFKTQCLTS